MKNSFAIVTLLAVLSACAVAPQRQGVSALVSAPVPPTVATDVAATEESTHSDDATHSDDVLPNVALTSDLLFKLTRAELDFGRGQWQGPYVTLMGAAQQTRDPRIAQRAVEMALAAKQGSEALAAIRLWRELAPDSEQANQYFLGFVVLSDNLDEAEQLFSKRLHDAAPAARGLTMLQMQQFLSHAKDKKAAFALLEQALLAVGKEQAHDADFYRGKLQACLYFYQWELPKITAQLDLLASLDTTTLDMQDAWF